MSMSLRMQELETKKDGERWYIRRHWQEMRLPTVVVGESKTQQSHRDTVDVNAIVKRFDRTGQLPPPRMEAQYGDVSGLNRPYSELIEESRQVLDKTGRYVEERDAKAVEEERQKTAAMEKELAEYRASKTAQEVKPPPT